MVEEATLDLRGLFSGSAEDLSSVKTSNLAEHLSLLSWATVVMRALS